MSSGSLSLFGTEPKEDSVSWYRKVDVRMWGDAKFAALSSRGKFLWFRLLTGPETIALPGVIPVGPGALAEALGWSLEETRDAFRELLGNGMVRADFETRLVFLPRALRYNPPAAPNVVISWRAPFDALPECALKAEILRVFADGLGELSEGFREAFRKAFGKACPIQDQDQDQEQKQEQDRERRAPALPPSAVAPQRRNLLPPSRPTPERRAARMPEGWLPSPEVIADLRAKLSVEPMDCWDDFADWAASSPTAKKLDWNATFRTWVRRAASRGEIERREPTQVSLASARAPEAPPASPEKIASLKRAVESLRTAGAPRSFGGNDE